MIRTLQDHGIHQGIDVHMECTVITLLKDGDRVAGALWPTTGSADASGVSSESRCAGHGRRRARIRNHEQ